VPEEMFANLLSLFDADGDGEISFHEFMTCVKRSVGPNGTINVQEEPKPETGIFGNSGAGYMERAKGNAAAKKKQQKVTKLLQDILEKIAEKHRTINKAFRFIDKDNSGSIDHDELRYLLESSGRKIDDETFEGVLAIFDADCSGDIEYREFLKHTKDIMQGGETDEAMGVQLSNKEALKRGRGGPAKQDGDGGEEEQTRVVGAALRYLCEKIHEKWADIRKSFMMLDWDKSGTISPTELRAVLDDCCYTVSDDVFDQMVAAFDEDGDGEIRYAPRAKRARKKL
jgi:Ca2+-binding EF-hand superfamily protein